MAKVWYTRVLIGEVKFSDVPDRYKKQVKALALEDVRSGVLPEEEYKQLFGED